MSYSHYLDKKLVVLLKRDDHKAMQTILLRYWEPLYKMAARTLQDSSVCEDIVQEIFIKIWEDRRGLNITYSLKAYLFASVRYEVYRQVKLKMRLANCLASHDLPHIEVFNPQNEIEYEELMKNVEKIVEKLPNRCKKIYQLSRNHQLTHKEIASKLDISAKTVENQLTIALRRIKLGIDKILLLFFF
ncbi:MAG TPA: RNA polymerase sigma-70 factor [Chitinophagaceae bacterium]|nr:RNA polymerase sigma-70 factor [Chitinophagaceae bacterium]